MRLAKSDDMNDFSTPDPEWMVVADSNGCKAKKRPSAGDSADSFPMETLSTTDIAPKYDFSVSLNDIRCIKQSRKGLGWQYLIIELEDGGALPAIHFHKGGCSDFLKKLEIYVNVTPSAKNSRLYNVSSLNSNALTQSFDGLELFGTSSEEKPQLAARFLQDPVGSAYSGFARVTNFLQDWVNPVEHQLHVRPDSETGLLVQPTCQAVGSSRIQIKEGEVPGGFEVITCAQLEPRSDPPRTFPIDAEFWAQHTDDEGRKMEPEAIKQAIFRGGIEAGMRKEVWKYLLGYYIWSDTAEQTASRRKEKEEDYYRMKMQWKSISAEQEKNFTPLRDNRSLIEKDVARTDRTRIFYEGEENISLKLLNDILMTYCMLNFDLGYVQGMSDLLSPILEVMENEVDAFWCFASYMNVVQDNFARNQHGMKRQLRDLRILLQFLEPKLWDHLEEKESTELFFCFRWLLIQFKREFSFEDIQTLWEVLWTQLPCLNFHLVICLALLDTEKPVITQQDCGFTEILKHVNDLSGRIDLDSTLRKAEGIYLQLATCQKDLPDNVRSILGM